MDAGKGGETGVSPAGRSPEEPRASMMARGSGSERGGGWILRSTYMGQGPRAMGHGLHTIHPALGP
jgi:hypothetical protein